eukprot:snap_masked-scaffold_4-processed-gene-20.1-mRNA-1 protein AED:1.00 eAED:1.00 QI:0/0/0/0/1/1/2/0/83
MFNDVRSTKEFKALLGVLHFVPSPLEIFSKYGKPQICASTIQGKYGKMEILRNVNFISGKSRFCASIIQTKYDKKNLGNRADQ